MCTGANTPQRNVVHHPNDSESAPYLLRERAVAVGTGHASVRHVDTDRHHVGTVSEHKSTNRVTYALESAYTTSDSLVFELVCLMYTDLISTLTYL